MQSVSSRIWTRVAVFISYDDNDYTTGTSKKVYILWSLVSKVFANGPGDLGSIPGRIIPKTLKMVLDTPLINTQKYELRIKGKVEQSRERSSVLPYTSV